MVNFPKSNRDTQGAKQTPQVVTEEAGHKPFGLLLAYAAKSGAIAKPIATRLPAENHETHP